MENFELLFATRVADGSAAPITRVIAAPSDSWAERIARAMEGEEIAPGRFLDRCEGTPQRSERGPVMGETLHGTAAAWGRVLTILNIPVSGVKWVYNWDIGLTYAQNNRAHSPTISNLHDPEICGFRFWPSEDPDAATEA